MLKLVVSILFIFVNFAFSQQAQDYFPSEVGYKWNFRVVPLDPDNNEINELAFREADSSAFIADYEGRNAYHILSKTGSDDTINFIPYTDTNYVSFSGSNGYEYYNLGILLTIFNALDSAGISVDSSIINIFNSFKGWYSFYRFGQNFNQQYTILSFDTTLTFDSLTIPLRYEIRGRRYQDESLNTEIGAFTCKKFDIRNILSYLIHIPPLPPIAVPIATITDTIWIAPDNWIVKDLIPSTVVDLTFFGLGSYVIPGLKSEITQEVTNVNYNDYQIPEIFSLKQNYPNPFNPLTKIKFALNTNGFVVLKIFNILGNEVAVLLNSNLSAGSHEIEFDGSDLASGNYFYNVLFYDSYGFSYSETKRMVLLK